MTEHNKYYDKIVNTLLTGKELHIDGIATIYCRRVGSRVARPKYADDYPHQELEGRVEEAKEGAISLKNLTDEEDFNKIITPHKGYYTIPEILRFKTKGDKVIIEPSEELKSTLNPFLTATNGRKKGKGKVIIIPILLALFAVIYIILPKVEEKAIPEVKPMTIVEDTIVKDTVIIEEKKPEIDRYLYYSVLGSYPKMVLAKRDSARMSRLCGDTTLGIRQKVDGKYIIYYNEYRDTMVANRDLVLIKSRYRYTKDAWIYQHDNKR